MNLSAGPTFRLHLAIALLSVGLIAFQLVLMQVLSITQWHHFAYLVISVALLGFGAAGTLLALFRERFLACCEKLLPLLSAGAAAAMPLAVALVQGPAARFDTYLVFLDPAQLGHLAVVILAVTAPFLLAALVLGLVFVRHVEGVGGLYCANLLGSGLGGLAGILLLERLDPPYQPAAAALFVLFAALLLLPRRRPSVPLAVVAGAGALLGLFLLNPPPLALSEYKDLRHTLELPGAQILASRPSAQGLVQVVESPALRHAPGLSLAFRGEVPAGPAVFVNGNWFGALPTGPIKQGATLLDFTTGALPYALATPREVLVLHSGTGLEVEQALAREARRVTGVEPHRAAVELARGQQPADPRFHQVFGAPRTFLAAEGTRYDLIQLPAVGSFGGGAGLFALQEQPLLTREALLQMLEHLTPDGLLAVTVWMDQPPRSPLRLAATLAEAIEAAGLGPPAQHLAAVRSWGTLTFCVKRSALTAEDVAKLRAFCKRLLFDPALLPELKDGERTAHNRLEDEEFFRLLDEAVSARRDRLAATYPFRLSVPGDDRPFFSQFLRWESLSELAGLFGARTFPFLEMGYLIAWLALLLLALASAALILLPLVRLGWRGGRRGATLVYFGGLGIGYMLVEMALIHRFVLYLGHPIHAAAAVIGVLLVCSGGGSLFSARLPGSRELPAIPAALVGALLLLYSLALPPVLENTLHLAPVYRVLITLALLAPPAFAMGLPFPLGLRALAGRREEAVPWAWGINGCLSVVSTALATLLAVEAGFTAVLLTAVTAYLTAALAAGQGRARRQTL
ncbi:hypothetical protein DESUT3_03020 [Desulfuromonas versatilis]|uniref:Spermidine synthase n=1 Tax=Desulfuromonas versatilis TaxID=2802975 RepID=A0ABM8HNU4_9BACT|nr:hypothetical protein [Desulfuromonas versatilis]BCR03233.1 hypothetical protein DESUT3_03020 [Desulfuromonas versatilis]